MTTTVQSFKAQSYKYHTNCNADSFDTAKWPKFTAQTSCTPAKNTVSLPQVLKRSVYLWHKQLIHEYQTDKPKEAESV